MSQDPQPPTDRSEGVRDVDREYALDDRYRLTSGRVFLTGVQALVRLPLMQRQRDLAAGLDTAGFISGYRGSPLGTYDMALWQARAFLEEHHIRFEPGVNEDLAATAVWGSQQANLIPGARYDGVFGIWYGKGPGVDRSCDALKHGNFPGTAPNGGVLALCGDDPGAKSSSIAHQSEQALIHCGIPILNPANVQDYLDLGLYGFALSRYSGCWVGFKCLTDTVESAASVEVGPERVRVRLPDDFELPQGGAPHRLEQHADRARGAALPLASCPPRRPSCARTGSTASFSTPPRRRLGIVTTGKAYLDVRQALDELGIDEARAQAIGLSSYKVGTELAPRARRRAPLRAGARRAAGRGGEAPDRRGAARAPALQPRRGARACSASATSTGRALVPSEVRARRPATVVGVAAPLARRDALRASRCRSVRRASRPRTSSPGARARRACRASARAARTTRRRSCPRAASPMGGIGCHGMAVWLPERRTLAVTQMGGEGANWIGRRPSPRRRTSSRTWATAPTSTRGCWRSAPPSPRRCNITYKILANGAVAMTGGQPIEGEPMAGEVTRPRSRASSTPRASAHRRRERRHRRSIRAARFPDGVERPPPRRPRPRAATSCASIRA